MTRYMLDTNTVSHLLRSHPTVRARMAGVCKVLAPLDMLIATHALSESAVLVTNDQAFWPMTGLKIEDWTV